jgi:hypothetical protein
MAAPEVVVAVDVVEAPAGRVALICVVIVSTTVLVGFTDVVVMTVGLLGTAEVVRVVLVVVGGPVVVVVGGTEGVVGTDVVGGSVVVDMVVGGTLELVSGGGEDAIVGLELAEELGGGSVVDVVGGDSVGGPVLELVEAMMKNVKFARRESLTLVAMLAIEQRGEKRDRK